MTSISNAPPTSKPNVANSMLAPAFANPSHDTQTPPGSSSSSTTSSFTPASTTTIPRGSELSQTPQLFASNLISPSVLSALPPNYTIRPLRRTDFQKGFLDVLRVLTSVGEITETRWNERYDWMHGRDEYFILVVLDGGSDHGDPKSSGTNEGKIVGTGALVVERKFIHNLGMVGHIEDIAVARDQQGKKLGLRIIEALDFVAKQVGCYKSILDCSEANEGFYVKCGFKRAGLEMAHYYETPKSKYEAS